MLGVRHIFEGRLPESTIHVFNRNDDDLWGMPNLYFCQPHAKNQGMLRAVLSLNECEAVMRRYRAIYLGEHFPQLSNDPEASDDFAVICFHPEETTAAWRPGYYRVDSDLTELNESLLAL